MTQCQVTRDGEPASPVLDSEGDAEVWLLRNQGQSIDYATRYGGYAIAAVAP